MEGDHEGEQGSNVESQVSKETYKKGCIRVYKRVIELRSI